MSEHTDRSLKTVTTTIDIVEALKEINGGTLTEIANYLELSKSGVYNHLVTLQERGYIVKTDNVYALSPKFILIGEHVRQESLLYQFGKDKLDELIKETGEYGQLVTERHGEGIVVYLTRGEKSIGSDYPQHMKKKPLHLHHTAAGKSILAHLPEERVEEIVEKHDLFARTNNTITTPKALYDELEMVRERGYATNKEEEVIGLRAIGAPIMGPDGEILGALSLSGPKSRMHGERFEDDLPEVVMNTVDIIEVNINMHFEADEF